MIRQNQSPDGLEFFARELERELNEEVLLNAKGAEREARLLARIAELEKDKARHE